MKTIYIILCFLFTHYFVAGQGVLVHLDKIQKFEPERVIFPQKGGTVKVSFFTSDYVTAENIQTALRQKLQGTPFSSATIQVAGGEIEGYDGEITITMPRTSELYFREYQLKLAKTSLFLRRKGSYGNLNRFRVSGGGVVVDTNSVVIRLSGTEPGVKYGLYRDGVQVAYLYGPANPDLSLYPEWPDDAQAEEVEKGKWQCYLDRPIEFKVREAGVYQIKATLDIETIAMLGSVTVCRYDGKLYTAGMDQVISGRYDSETVTSNRIKRVDDVLYTGPGGRSRQLVSVAASPSGKDIVTPFGFGKLGREEKKFLPFESTAGTGTYLDKNLFASRWGSIYGSDESNFAFSFSTFETSPLGRVLTETGPGKNWHQAGKRVTLYYGTNTANEVRRWKVDAAGTLVDGGYYPANSLSRERTTDEDGNITESFTAARGQMVESVTYLSGQRLATSNVHDDLGRLRHVLSPEANARGPLTAGIIGLYGYYYAYDGKGRVTEKKLPGCAPVYLVYDKRDRLVMMQDGNQRAEDAKKWSYSLYDALNREVESGEVILSAATTHAALQTAASASSGYTPAGTRTALKYTAYDTYPASGNVIAIPFVATAGYATAPGTRTGGKVTSVKTRVLGTSTWLTSTTYYDDLGRVIQTASDNLLGYKSRVDMTYNFAGNVLKTREAHGYSATGSDVLETVNTYDRRGRLLSSSSTLNGGTPAVVQHEYDAVGRLKTNKYKTGATFLAETMTYNARGWLTSKTSTPFTMTLRYETTALGASGKKYYNGDISEWEWKNGTTAPVMYALSYDGLNRLSGSVHYQGGTAWTALAGNNAYDEKGLTYDRNGNILTLTRTGVSASTLAYTYTGNRLTGLTKNGVTGTYSHDPNGNMINDSRKSLNFEYNILNLLAVVKTGTTLKASYTYLADGTKLRVADASGNGFYYLGSLTYVKNSAGIQLEGATTASGRVLVGTGSRTGNDIRYFLTDHLGSVRSIVDQTGTVKERNDYYPFGTRYSQSGGNVDPTNRLKYNGKEEQTTGNLGYLDYGARMYDAELGRWFSVDPMAESYYSLSSYNYCANSPILFIDPDGQAMDWFVDADGSLYYDPFMKKGDESKLGDSWSWLGENGMFGTPDRNILNKYSNRISKKGFSTKEMYIAGTGEWRKVGLPTAYFDRNNALEVMDDLGYKYAMTQYVEDKTSYTMYLDKGRGHMADFIYGKQKVSVEKATYLPKDKSVHHYQGIENIGKAEIKWNITMLSEKSLRRYSHPVVVDAFWNTFWNLTKFGSKFGSEFDYRDKIMSYKKTGLK